jgi:hypothetical protein
MGEAQRQTVRKYAGFARPFRLEGGVISKIDPSVRLNTCMTLKAGNP